MNIGRWQIPARCLANAVKAHLAGKWPVGTWLRASPEMAVMIAESSPPGSESLGHPRTLGVVLETVGTGNPGRQWRKVEKGPKDGLHHKEWPQRPSTTRDRSQQIPPSLKSFR